MTAAGLHLDIAERPETGAAITLWGISMTFSRRAALPLGHRFYTSARSISEWGTGGPHASGGESYDSRGWVVPPKPEHIAWSDYAPGRIRPFRSPPHVLAAEWIGSRVPLPRTPRSIINQPNDGPTAEWRAERDAAGFAIDHGTEGNRIERALVKEMSPLVATLRQVAELMRPPVVDANDDAPSAKDANPGKEGERVHNQGGITPSIPMLLRAVADGMRPRVIRHPDGTMTRIATGHKAEGGWHLVGWKKGQKLHGIIIHDGEMVAYGDDRGRSCRPKYVADPRGLVFDKESETAKHIARRPDENRTYIRLAGRERYVSAQSPDAPRSIAPPPRTARAVANDNNLAAAIANTPVMPAVTKLPDGVAYEYGRLAGIADMTGAGEGGTSAPMHDALAEMDRADKLAAAGFDADDLEIIEDILSDASFRTIGIARGYAESSAHRMGRKVVEDALKKISEKIAA
ncbi:MAG: hypothetical protein QHC90_23165 [Shinella sp.]|nr:hypothetical protein [Shinella sp.]